MDDLSTQEKYEAAAFRQLIAHLRERHDVQNIDMMNLTGFCRNCLARWYQEAVQDDGQEMDKATARQLIYGMDYEIWREQYQSEATQVQKDEFAKIMK